MCPCQRFSYSFDVRKRSERLAKDLRDSVVSTILKNTSTSSSGDTFVVVAGYIWGYTTLVCEGRNFGAGNRCCRVVNGLFTTMASCFLRTRIFKYK